MQKWRSGVISFMHFLLITKINPKVIIFYVELRVYLITSSWLNIVFSFAINLQMCFMYIFLTIRFFLFMESAVWTFLKDPLFWLKQIIKTNFSWRGHWFLFGASVAMTPNLCLKQEGYQIHKFVHLSFSHFMQWLCYLFFNELINQCFIM